MNSYLCDCCDELNTGEPYVGKPDRMSLDHQVCYTCARRYTWVWLESPEGQRLIDRDEPIRWQA